MKKTLRKATIGALLGAAFAIATPGAQAQVVEIKVSYQPALYWALPFFVAT